MFIAVRRTASLRSPMSANRRPPRIKSGAGFRRNMRVGSDADRRSGLLDGARQRKPGAFIEVAHLFHAEAHFFDQQVRARQNRGGQLLDDEAHGFGGGVEPLVLGPALARPAAAEEQLRSSVVIEAGQITRRWPRAL